MILGHQKQIKFLKQNIENDKIAHGYLFEGPLMIGKKRVAIQFAKSLFCEGKEFGGCNHCYNCLNIEARNFQNIFFIEEEKEIPISAIRSLRNFLNLKSNFYKVVILDNAHNLNSESSNAFLKILEEPKGDSVFILITNKPDLLLKTITSRLQRLKFFSVLKSELKDFFEDKIKTILKLSQKDFQDLLSIANGRAGFLFKIVENPDVFNEVKETSSNFIKFLRTDIVGRLDLIENQSLEDISEIFNTWFLLLHYLLVKQIMKQSCNFKSQEESIPTGAKSSEESNFNFFNQDYTDLLNKDLNRSIHFLLKLNSLNQTNINKKLALGAYSCLV